MPSKKSKKNKKQPKAAEAKLEPKAAEAKLEPKAAEAKLEPKAPEPKAAEPAMVVPKPGADVSILTPCQEKRYHMLNLNVETISRQTWVHRIKEWVVIDGTADGPSDKWASTKRDVARWLAEDPRTAHIQLVDAGDPPTRFIGGIRNKIIDTMTGEWGVWIDDDDVYPATRVEAAITLMQQQKRLVAGCSPHYITDPDLGNITFQFKVFHPNHATNNTMAFHRDILKTSRYQDTAKNAEEGFFLNQFKTDMSQIPAEHAVLQMAHKQNTYNKRELLMTALTARNFSPEMEQQVSCRAVGTSATSKPGSFINVSQRIVNAYKAALFDDLYERSEYDIVWYLGLHRHRPPWSPYDASIGGSEQAVVHLSEEWAKRGYKVAVYGHIYSSDKEKPMLTPNDSFTCNNVEYHSAMTFRASHHYRNLIIWRAFGATPITYVKLHADRLILDLHDRHTHDQFELTFGASCSNQFDIVNVKSKFHTDQVLETLRAFGNRFLLTSWEKRMFVQPNGVRRDVFFDEARAYAYRDPYRLVYCSSYDRGLEQLLMWFFPTLRKMDKRFTLDVMYGMSAMPPEQQEKMKRLLSQPGVTDHGRISREEVSEFKYKCGFHLYYTWTTAEIDCISVRESALCGCVPILSHIGVFAERAGLHYAGDPTKPKDHAIVANVFHEIVKNSTQESLQDMRKQCVESNLNFDWDVSARSWMDTALLLPPPPCEQPTDADPPATTFDYERDIVEKAKKDQEKYGKVTLSV